MSRSGLDRTNAEPETIAYIAIGADKAWRDAGQPDLDAFEGHYGYIQTAVDHALKIDQVTDLLVFDGVMAYDIAEPFGVRFGNDALVGDPKVGAIVRDLFFEAGVPEHAIDPVILLVYGAQL